MIPKTMLSFASVATLLLAASFTPVAANTTAQRVAQAGAPATMPLTRQENDARMETCLHYRDAYHRLDDIKRQLMMLQNAFVATDDIRPKLDALMTQTNDAQMTARLRTQGEECRSHHH